MKKQIEPSYVMQQMITTFSLMKRKPPKPPKHHHEKMHLYTHNMKRSIGILAEMGSMNQRSLSKQLQIKAQSVTAIVKKLEADGLIQKEEDPVNKSSTLLVLTKIGQQHADNFGNEIKDHSQSFFKDLSQEELKTLSTLLEKIIHSNNHNKS